MSALKRRWKLAPVAALVVALAAFATSAATAKSTASTIKIAVMSDCQGAFGSFDNQDLAGVVTAIRVVWGHVGVAGPVGSHWASPPSRSTRCY